MNTLVVLFAVASVACGSVVQLAQPAHYPALVLDPHGRPLDTAEVINARALHLQAKALEHHAPLYAHSAVYAAPLAQVYAAPAAVSHQSRYDVHTSHGHPLLAHSALHLLKKRSLGHLAYAAPSAVSHQSRVDVISSPAVVSHAVHAPVLAHAVHAPVFAVAPAAVSHQSRVDVRTSPALVSHAYAPLAHSYGAAPVLAHASPLSYSVLASPYAHSLSHGHYLKKRSLATYLGSWSHAVPAAVSHQSRVDVHSSPAIVSHAIAAPVVSHAVAPVVVAHAAPALYAAPAAVSHQSRVDYISSAAHIAPLAHSAVWTSPISHLSHASLW